MICPICKTRWADFPKEDFTFIEPHGKIKLFFSRITFNLIKRNGFYPKHDEAGFNRGIAYGSNEIKSCFNCLETTDACAASDMGFMIKQQADEVREMIKKGLI